MCPVCPPAEARVVKRGFFAKASGRTRRVQRFACRRCGRNFSAQTLSSTYRERKSHLNQRVFRLLSIGVSQRETARQLGTSPRTVARKLVRLARCARHHHERSLLPTTRAVVFDEMETFEHTKMKPLSIALAVEEKSRKILFVKVARMPAKGLLAERSRRKYGRRPDHRPRALRELLTLVGKLGGETLTLKSDESPRYPPRVAEVLPKARHVTYKGRRGCVVGQGELKAGGFDPLFSLNHTCALARDRIKRLARRTWCTTKRPDRLQCLLDLAAYFHNQRLEAPNGRIRLDRVVNN